MKISNKMQLISIRLFYYTYKVYRTGTHAHLSLSAIVRTSCEPRKQVHHAEIGFAEVGAPVGVYVGIIVVGKCLPGCEEFSFM